MCVCSFPRTKIATNLGHLRPIAIRQAAVFTIKASWEAWAHATRRADTRSSWEARIMNHFSSQVVFWDKGHIPYANILYLHTYRYTVYIYMGHSWENHPDTMIMDFLWGKSTGKIRNAGLLPLRKTWFSC